LDWDWPEEGRLGWDWDGLRVWHEHMLPQLLALEAVWAWVGWWEVGRGALDLRPAEVTLGP
jgi:hypothetical protein